MLTAVKPKSKCIMKSGVTLLTDNVDVLAVSLVWLSHNLELAQDKILSYVTDSDIHVDGRRYYVQLEALLKKYNSIRGIKASTFFKVRDILLSVHKDLNETKPNKPCPSETLLNTPNLNYAMLAPDTKANQEQLTLLSSLVNKIDKLDEKLTEFMGITRVYPVIEKLADEQNEIGYIDDQEYTVAEWLKVYHPLVKISAGDKMRLSQSISNAVKTLTGSYPKNKSYSQGSTRLYTAQYFKLMDECLNQINLSKYKYTK